MKRPVAKYEIRLALRYVSGEISRQEMVSSFPHGRGNNYEYRVVMALKKAFRAGAISVKQGNLF